MAEERRNTPELTEIEIDEPKTEAKTVVCNDCGRTIGPHELFVEFLEDFLCAECFLKHTAEYAAGRENPFSPGEKFPRSGIEVNAVTNYSLLKFVDPQIGKNESALTIWDNHGKEVRMATLRFARND